MKDSGPQIFKEVAKYVWRVNHEKKISATSGSRLLQIAAAAQSFVDAYYRRKTVDDEPAGEKK